MDLKHEQGPHGLDHSALHLLHRAGQLAGDLFSEEAAGGGLTPRQFVVLLAVSREEGLSQTALVERTGIDRSTLADIIRRLQKRGLVSRRRTRADARVYSVKLTVEGAEALRAAQPGASRAEARLLSGLPPDMRETFLKALDTMVKTLEPGNGRDGG